MKIWLVMNEHGKIFGAFGDYFAARDYCKEALNFHVQEVDVIL